MSTKVRLILEVLRYIFISKWLAHRFQFALFCYGLLPSLSISYRFTWRVLGQLYNCPNHYSDVIMGTMASQITSLTIVYSTIYSGADQRKHQSSASLAFVRGIHRWLVNSPHKSPVTRKMFPFHDVFMASNITLRNFNNILWESTSRWWYRDNRKSTTISHAYGYMVHVCVITYTRYRLWETVTATYTAHKKFMNGFACRGLDPYVAVISTSRCQKTPVCKPAK